MCLRQKTKNLYAGSAIYGLLSPYCFEENKTKTTEPTEKTHTIKKGNSQFNIKVFANMLQSHPIFL